MNEHLIALVAGALVQIDGKAMTVLAVEDSLPPVPIVFDDLPRPKARAARFRGASLLNLMRGLGAR